jgi:hypothetical protein
MSVTYAQVDIQGGSSGAPALSLLGTTSDETVGWFFDDTTNSVDLVFSNHTAPILKIDGTPITIVTNAILKDGSVAMEADFDMGGFSITDLVGATASGEVKAGTLTSTGGGSFANSVTLSGGFTAGANANMGSHDITNIANATASGVVQASTLTSTGGGSFGTSVTLTGGFTSGGDANMGTHNITNVNNFTAAGDVKMTGPVYFGVLAAQDTATYNGTAAIPKTVIELTANTGDAQFTFPSATTYAGQSVVLINGKTSGSLIVSNTNTNASANMTLTNGSAMRATAGRQNGTNKWMIGV